MDDSVFDEVMGQTFGTPEAGTSESGSATAVMDAETAGWVSEEPAGATFDGTAPADPGSDPASFEGGTSDEVDIEQAKALFTELLESDANPYKQQALDAQARIQQSLQFLELQRMQQQRAQLNAALQARIDRLPDLDPETQAQEVRRLIAERETLTQMAYQQQLQQKEQQAEALARTQVIAMLANQHQLTETEVQTMAALDDPWRMEEFARMAVTNRHQAMSEVEQLRARLAELESTTAARQRISSGADRVGAGQATAVRSRSPQPRNFEEFWETWVNQG